MLLDTRVWFLGPYVNHLLDSKTGCIPPVRESPQDLLEVRNSVPERIVSLGLAELPLKERLKNFVSCP